MYNFAQQANYYLRVPFNYEPRIIVLGGHLQTADKAPKFRYIIRGMPEGPGSYGFNMPKIISKDYSIACSSWVAL
jgi:hypothetical protein